ncbi:MAG TPA: DUF3467 domain-containing protein [Nitrospirales bacterium]|jgi:hypothetical protein
MTRKNEESEDVRLPEARYANYVELGHNAFEFLFDFGQCYDEFRKTFHTRIVTSPDCAQRLAELLQGSLDQYEQRFGMIRRDRSEGTQD